MAVFGAPRPAADHARRALACAAAMQRRQATLNIEAEQQGLPAFQIGIGVNTETVIAGTLGGPGRLDYTVIGDAVNIAQRLQALAGGGEILARPSPCGNQAPGRLRPSGSGSSRDGRNWWMPTGSAGRTTSPKPPEGPPVRQCGRSADADR